MKTWTGSSRGTGAEWKCIAGDPVAILNRLPPDEFNCVITSPYYWLRGYGVRGQIGHEEPSLKM